MNLRSSGIHSLLTAFSAKYSASSFGIRIANVLLFSRQRFKTSMAYLILARVISRPVCGFEQRCCTFLPRNRHEEGGQEYTELQVHDAGDMAKNPLNVFAGPIPFCVKAPERQA